MSTMSEEKKVCKAAPINTLSTMSTMSKPSAKKNNKFILHRTYYKEATAGILADDKGNFICEILERPNLNNAKDNPNTKENESSCIPEGKYSCKKYSSTKYPDTWEICNVPNRSAILFHCANYVDELKGCLATVTAVRDMNPAEDKKCPPEKRYMGVSSREAFKIFKEAVPEQFTLIIKSS